VLDRLCKAQFVTQDMLISYINSHKYTSLVNDSNNPSQLCTSFLILLCYESAVIVACNCIELKCRLRLKTEHNFTLDCND
jgi:hypothetical protein